MRHKLTLFPILGIILLLNYGLLFWFSLSEYWFNPAWTTDDAMQQIFPFHKVYNPGIFEGDYITTSMTAYLAPVHYYLAYAVTWLTGDPIMMSHWLMLIQMLGTLIFLFLAVQKASATFPACIAVVWFIHSRHLVQRLTGGLPRGWIAPMIAMYFYFMISRKHWAVIITLMLSCLLNPLAAFMLTIAYGLNLLWLLYWKESRALTWRPFIRFLLACPVIAGTTYVTTARPPELGHMVTYEEAMAMPELSKEGGRFKIVPFQSPWSEITNYGSQVFVTAFYKGPKFFKRNMHWFICGILALLLLLSIVRKQSAIPSELTIFLTATIVAYLLARQFAFELYIPTRYLRFPIGMFLIASISIGVWKAFAFRLPNFNVARTHLDLVRDEIRVYWASFVAFIAIAILVFLGSGDGLARKASFNYVAGQDGHVFEWIRKNTFQDSVIAGHPLFMDAIPLFAIRRVYVSNETTHPFYDKYYSEMKRRTEISLKAHFARNLRELSSILEHEKIDYFVFERKRFYPDELKAATYFAPFDILAEELTRPPYEEFAYRALPEEVDTERYPFMLFKDTLSVLIDVKKLKKYLENPSNA